MKTSERKAIETEPITMYRYLMSDNRWSTWDSNKERVMDNARFFRSRHIESKVFELAVK